MDDNLIVKEIQSWPDQFVMNLAQRMANFELGVQHCDELIELDKYRITENGKNFTEFGSTIGTLLREETWQTDDELTDVLNTTNIDNLDSVIEVGCSTGYAIRNTFSTICKRRVGVDICPVRLALADRLATIANEQLEFAAASGEALPYSDSEFDLVICRNALTYMPQSLAISEMARVIRSGGIILLRFENLYYDFKVISSTRGLRAILARMRDLFWGSIQLLGLKDQFPGVRSWEPRRTCSSIAFISKHLKKNNCELLHFREAKRCPKFFGKSTQTTLLATKK